MYQSCHTCGTRMIRLGQGGEEFGSPPMRRFAYYLCPGCGRHWTVDREGNGLAEGLPPEAFQELVREGRLSADGTPIPEH